MLSLSGHSVYHLDVLTVWFCLLTEAHAYVNVALNKTARLHYPFKLGETYMNDITIFDASNAVDGRKSNLHVLGGQCVASYEYKQTATWWVNLTSIHSIHHITIYFMTGNLPLGPSNTHTQFFLGFSVYVSNTTDRLQGALCYKDDNFTLDTMPAVFTTTCPVHGQYVIYYNERLPGVTYPDGYSNGVDITLCEVEVYGCPATGYFGSGNCSVPCPDVNCLYCHIETGNCQGCKPGYQGHRCELACEGETYGAGCKETCGHCRDVNQCSKTNGTCLTGCDAGFEGDMCKTICTNNTYGQECSMKCGHCLYMCGEQCHHVTGQCPRGCDVGFQGDRCDQAFESRSSDIESKCETSTALYVSVTIIALSLSLNGYFIIIQLRNRNVRRQQKNPENVDKHVDGGIKDSKQREHFSTSVYDQAETNAAYQELGEITKESQYDKLS